MHLKRYRLSGFEDCRIYQQFRANEFQKHLKSVLVIGHKTILANILNLFPRFDARSSAGERGVPSNTVKTEVCQVFMPQKGTGVIDNHYQLQMTEKLTQTAISVEDTEDRFFTMLMN